MKLIFRTSILLALVISMASCQDVVEVKLEDGISQLVVDAFVNDKEEPKVVLLKSQNYFDNSELDYVADAIVSISGGGETFELTYDGTSSYTGDVINFVDEVDYKLEIEYDGDVYEAFSSAEPVPEILEMEYEFEEGVFDSPDGFVAGITAYDLADRLDYYWIKYYRNGEYENDPTDLNICQDGSFGDQPEDGNEFIPPVAYGMNDFDSLWQVGEVCRVELLSINPEVYEFMQEVMEQTANEGITATPSYNLRSNITHVSGPDENGALGMFSVSKMSDYELLFEE